MTKVTSYRSRLHWLRPRSYSPRPEDHRLVQTIQCRAKELNGATPAQLAERIDTHRKAISEGTSPLDRTLLTDVFACVYEAVRQQLGLSFYDVQLLSGIVLATGAIAEMKTGEGKTLVTALPATLAAIQSRGVHVATVNSYLATRDFDQLKPVYELLGLSVGLLRDKDTPKQKRAAYSADITYGTGYEFGFDFLRDQLALQGEARAPLGDQFLRQLRGQATMGDSTVQNQLAFAIIDEVDSVLIDEANTPLVISGPSGGAASNTDAFVLGRDLARTLTEDVDYQLDNRKKKIELTDSGLDRVFEQQPIGLQRPWSIYIEQALRAELVLQRDRDYVVTDDSVKIVDAYTGRIFDERTWRDGLHQAVEAKEDATITDENRSLAQVSRQRFYQQYHSLCGMTGTACGHESEFERFYKLPVVRIPQRKQNRRTELRPRFFRDTESKLRFAAASIQTLHQTGRPVLVGTRTIDASLQLSKLLREVGLRHRILNGVQDEAEANVISTAGEFGAITIATNMAGRGTDIKLTTPSHEAGGLHVLALEFHDSQRIDRQLEGRAARQGEPGSFQFLASAEDDLLQTHDPNLAQAIERDAQRDGVAKKDFHASIRRVQAIAEKQNYDLRCGVYQQQKWLDKILTTIAEPTKQNKSGVVKGAAA